MFVTKVIVVLQCLLVFRCFLNIIILLQKNLTCNNLHESCAYIYALEVMHIFSRAYSYAHSILYICISSFSISYSWKTFWSFYGPVWDLQYSQCFGEIVGPSWYFELFASCIMGSLNVCSGESSTRTLFLRVMDTFDDDDDDLHSLPFIRCRSFYDLALPALSAEISSIIYFASHFAHQSEFSLLGHTR